MPTGGIGSGILLDYLAFDRVVACGGSWMAPAELLRASRFDTIRGETARTMLLVSSAASRA
jgi:2-dehydro-3-deoxyphosphogluconate aldolase/(4S)-4-hydroxy-2-oxoglutarate aldolase